MKTIVLSASVTAYKKVIEVKHQLENMGFEVSAPDLALKMEEHNDYSLSNETAEEKIAAMRDHYDKIAKGDALLVINEPKNGLEGYIGPSVLIEMGLAFYLRKPIYLLYPMDPSLPARCEIDLMTTAVLNGDLELLASNN